MMKHTLLLLFLLKLSLSSASILDSVSRQVLVQVSVENSNMEYVQSLFPEAIVSMTAPSFQIWKVQFSSEIPIHNIKEYYNQNLILNFVRNRHLSERGTTPNDPLFSKQSHLFNNIHTTYNIPSGINAVGAWDFNKSATTALGDTIVVGVCDFGFDTVHEDIDYFINRNEIPYNGIDDDGNGAKDDYLGWNVQENNYNIGGSNKNHGMFVIGRIAAKGNNGKGVAGVAWNCKILPIGCLTWGIEDNIKAFEYFMNMKKLYWSSNKTKGAYIVAINNSLGTNGFLPQDEPLWCAIFDSLGKYGILATQAADNVNMTAESRQDMPILCNSPYMINVTAHDSAQIGLAGSTYSPTCMHLAAPNNFISTLPNNSYGNMAPGASFSAPLVAGAIALMYSNLDARVLDTLHKNPLLVTSKIKELILKNVDVSPNLTGKLVSNGKLNLYKSVLRAQSLQDSFFKSSAIQSNLSNDISIYSYDKTLVVKRSKIEPAQLMISNILGQKVYTQTITELDNTITLDLLHSGIYIIQYQDQESFRSQKIEIR